jgi:hypothetical protein
MSTDLHDPLERAADSAPDFTVGMATLERRRDQKVARRRVGALVLGLAITVVIAGSALALMGSGTGEPDHRAARDPGAIEIPTVEQIVNGEAPIGRQLAEQLHLSEQPRAQDNCQFYAPIDELVDGAESGYCIDHLSDDQVLLYVIAAALRGNRVTLDDLPDIRKAVQAFSVSPSEGGPVGIYSSTADQILALQRQVEELSADLETATDGAELDLLRKQLDLLRVKVQDLCTSLDEVPLDVAGLC